MSSQLPSIYSYRTQGGSFSPGPSSAAGYSLMEPYITAPSYSYSTRRQAGAAGYLSLSPPSASLPPSAPNTHPTKCSSLEYINGTILFWRNHSKHRAASSRLLLRAACNCLIQTVVLLSLLAIASSLCWSPYTGSPYPTPYSKVYPVVPSAAVRPKGYGITFLSGKQQTTCVLSYHPLHPIILSLWFVSTDKCHWILLVYYPSKHKTIRPQTQSACTYDVMPISKLWTKKWPTVKIGKNLAWKKRILELLTGALQIKAMNFMNIHKYCIVIFDVITICKRERALDKLCML